MKVNGKDYLNIWWNNKKCSKPPTSNIVSMVFSMYPVVNIQFVNWETWNIAIFYSWVNQLFLWPCSIAIVKLPEGPKRRAVAESTTGRLLAWISTVKCEFKVEHWNQNPKLNIWKNTHISFLWVNQCKLYNYFTISIVIFHSLLYVKTRSDSRGGWTKRASSDGFNQLLLHLVIARIQYLVYGNHEKELLFCCNLCIIYIYICMYMYIYICIMYNV